MNVNHRNRKGVLESSDGIKMKCYLVMIKIMFCSEGKQMDFEWLTVELKKLK